jgi:PAS domain S-box-containing protein
MHALLRRQLKKLALDPETPPSAAEWASLLARVSQTYAQADQDRYMLERSLEASSTEMQALYDEVRLKSEAEVVKSLAIMAAIQESVADGILVHDHEGRAISHNRRFLEMWGIPEEHLRQPGFRFCPELIADRMKDPAAYLARARASIPSTSAIEPTNDVELVDGRTFERYTAPFRTADGAVTGRVVCYRDVTEQRRLAAQRVVVAERMAAVGQLVASVAHEINNPLAYISGNVELVAEELASRAADRDAPLAEALEDVRVGVDRVKVIVRDLGALSRIDEEKRAPVDVQAAVESALHMANNQIRHRAKVVRELAPVPRVDANEARLVQVLLNLLVNGAHAIAEGRASENTIRAVTRVSAEGMVVIEIHDTGSGIKPEQIDRIFDPFFTTKPLGSGTGLGLSICKGIVEKLGGAIRVTSTVGRGSCFAVELPPSASAAAAAEDAGCAASVMVTRRRVLVVDDDVQVRRWFTRVLEGGHEATVVGTVDEAARAIDERAFDAILCDVMMPDRTGLDMHELVKHRHPELLPRFILMSGGAFTPTLEAFFESYGGERLEKPIRKRDLEAAIERVSAEGGAPRATRPTSAP